jgi:hypothetical protein
MFLRSQSSSIYSLHAKQISTFSFEMHLILQASEKTTEGERWKWRGATEPEEVCGYSKLPVLI